MIGLILVSVLICIAAVNAGVVPNGGTTTNIQGPSSRSRIVGPDGSVITAQAPGGQIIHEETPGVFEPAGRFLDTRLLGPASPLINPAVPGIAAHRAIDSVVEGPTRTIATGQQIAKTAENDTHSVMGVLGTPTGYIAGIGVESR